MCRMIAAPFGIQGRRIIEPFVRMARGENAVHEHNTTHGEFQHPHGWGTVYIERGKIETYRSARPCWEDEELKQFYDRTIIILHARRASRGGVSMDNVHPFHLTHNGRSWYFCHNGTIDDKTIAQYGGETDSERYLGHLLSQLDNERPIESIETAVNTLHNYTSLNAFLTDGNHFYTINRYTTSPRYYTLYFHQDADGPIISSEPLLDIAPTWEPLKNGRIIAYEVHAKKSTLPS